MYQIGGDSHMVSLTMSNVGVELPHSIKKRFVYNSIFLRCFESQKHRTLSWRAYKFQRFDYSDGLKGPANWGGICLNGTKQSPIDIARINGALVPALSRLNADYVTAPATVRVNNITRQLEVEGSLAVGFGALDLNIILQVASNATGPQYVGNSGFKGNPYTLKKFHFHAPSEHTIEGKSFPLELHLFHTTNAGDKAVIGVLFGEGAESPFLSQFWNQLSNLSDQPQVPNITFSQLPLETSSYATYEGSLTTPTPDCLEGVTWIVLLNKDITISKEQLDAYSQYFKSSNNRPIQPLNGRKVSIYADGANPPDISGVSSYNGHCHHEWAGALTALLLGLINAMHLW